MTTRYIKLVEKKEFVIVALEPKHITFINHIASLNFTSFNIYLSRKPQIIRLIAKKASIKVFIEYANFVKIFFLDLTFELSKHTRINNYVIKLVDG